MSESIEKPFYLAGPMTGYPQFNYPLFDEVAQHLRDGGMPLVSPAEMDDPEVRKMAMASKDGAPQEDGETWGDFLARDVKVIADECEGIVLLPNWWNSRGARLECYVAMQCRYPLLEFDKEVGILARITYDRAMSLIALSTREDEYVTTTKQLEKA